MNIEHTAAPGRPEAIRSWCRADSRAQVDRATTNKRALLRGHTPGIPPDSAWASPKKDSPSPTPSDGQPRPKCVRHGARCRHSTHMEGVQKEDQTCRATTIFIIIIRLPAVCPFLAPHAAFPPLHPTTA